MFTWFATDTLSLVPFFLGKLFVCFPLSVGAAVLFLVLSVAITTANTLVIVVIWKDPFKELKGSSANYLILNLAVSDLPTGFPAMFLTGLSWLCSAKKSLLLSAYISIGIPLAVSHITIISLAIERLIVVSYPFRSADYLTARCLTVWIVSIWTATISTALFLDIKILFHVGKSKIIFGDLPWVFGVVSIILLLTCYMRIYMMVRKTLYLDITTLEERRTEGEALTENARRKENSKRMERSVLSTVLGLTVIYLVCWTPIYVLQKLDTDCNSFKFSIWKFLLLSLHALLDPLCYSLRTAKFRRVLLKIWSELFNHNNGGTFGR